MKHLLLAIAITLITMTAAQAADLGVAVTIGQPGLYGSFAIGGFPPPAVVYPHAVVVRPAPVVIARPVHAHVPPGHVKHGYYHGYPVYYRHDGRYYR